MSGDLSSKELDVQPVMWLVFEYARIMDGSDALVGFERSKRVAQAHDKDAEIRAAIRALVNSTHEPPSEQDTGRYCVERVIDCGVSADFHVWDGGIGVASDKDAEALQAALNRAPSPPSDARFKVGDIVVYGGKQLTISERIYKYRLVAPDYPPGSSIEFLEEELVRGCTEHEAIGSRARGTSPLPECGTAGQSGIASSLRTAVTKSERPYGCIHDSSPTTWCGVCYPEKCTATETSTSQARCRCGVLKSEHPDGTSRECYSLSEGESHGA